MLLGEEPAADPNVSSSFCRRGAFTRCRRPAPAESDIDLIHPLPGETCTAFLPPPGHNNCKPFRIPVFCHSLELSATPPLFAIHFHMMVRSPPISFHFTSPTYTLYLSLSPFVFCIHFVRPYVGVRAEPVDWRLNSPMNVSRRSAASFRTTYLSAAVRISNHAKRTAPISTIFRRRAAAKIVVYLPTYLVFMKRVASAVPFAPAAIDVLQCPRGTRKYTYTHVSCDPLNVNGERNIT